MTTFEIRTQYPDPWSDPDERLHTTCGYCVGGALILAHGGTTRFPTTAVLTHALANFNHSLNELLANQFALWIIEANDAREFEAAWEYAEQALTYRG